MFSHDIILVSRSFKKKDDTVFQVKDIKRDKYDVENVHYKSLSGENCASHWITNSSYTSSRSN
jgi:hypothetical protein